MTRKQLITIGLIVVVVTTIFGTMYIVQQQALRIGANDPQIQIAEDTTLQLNDGTKPDKVISGKIDLVSSLAPFTIIYDKSGNVVAGTGYLNNQIPTVPFGVLQNSDGKSYNSVTWQPSTDVRIASVTVSASKYYVLSGRSLKEVEKRENTLTQYVFLGWSISLLSVIIAAGLIPKVNRR